MIYGNTKQPCPLVGIAFKGLLIEDVFQKNLLKYILYIGIILEVQKADSANGIAVSIERLLRFVFCSHIKRPLVVTFPLMTAAVIAMSIAAAMGEACHAIVFVVGCFGAALHSADLVVIVTISQGVSGVVGVAMLVQAGGIAVFRVTKCVGFACAGAAAVSVRRCYCRQKRHDKNSRHKDCGNFLLHGIDLQNDMFEVAFTLYTIAEAKSFHCS